MFDVLTVWIQPHFTRDYYQKIKTQIILKCPSGYYETRNGKKQEIIWNMDNIGYL